MHLHDIVAADAIVPALRATNKKQALMDISERAGRLTGLAPREIFDTLIQRERLGSTGIGEGVAIPHGKLARCPRLFGLFARLERPIPFDALDDAPVDLIFMLLAPENAGADHLNALSKAARALRDPGVLSTIRATRDRTAIYAVLVGVPTPNAA